jgi:hypothetical protein
MSSPYNAMVRYMSAASLYIEKAETIKGALKTLNAQGTQEALRWKYGESRWKQIHSNLKEAIQGEIFVDGRITPMSEGEGTLKKMRNNFTFFALAASVTVPVMQVLSFGVGIAKSAKPLQTTIRAGGSVIRNAPKMIATATHNVFNFFSGNKRGYKHILQGSTVYDLWEKFAPHLIERHGNPETGDIKIGDMKGFQSIEVAGIRIGEALMSGITTMDALTVGALWESSFNTWTRFYTSDAGGNMTEQEAMLGAAEKANEMISTSQPPTFIHERSLLVRKNEWIKSLFMFTGATMPQFETFMTDVAIRSQQAIRDVKKNGFSSLYEVFVKGDDLQSGIVTQTTVGFIAPALLFGLLSRKRPHEDEREMLWDVVSYPLAMLPELRAIFGMMLGYSPYSTGLNTYYGAVMKEMMQGFTGAMKVAHGDDWSMRTIDDLADVLALMAGAPKVAGRIFSTAVSNASGVSSDLEEDMKNIFIKQKKESHRLGK